jgi:peptidoglycan/LPS O-acetylase OafA/YrhL
MRKIHMPLPRGIRNLQSLRTLNSPERNSAVDVFRAVAIIVVALYHFKEILPLGYIGVDLFFVISGLLVGGLLTRSFAGGKKINFFKFFLQRGFKIWPSYFIFLGLGTVIAFYLAPDQVIPLWDIKRYIFFYQNYTGAPFHWSFDHVWSLCIEEHFYIMLPIAFIIVQRIYNKKEALFGLVGLVIVSGIVFKLLSLWFTRSQDTYSGTHVRIDALGWGVLLNLIIVYYPQLLKQRRSYLVSLLGTLMGIAAVVIFCNTDSVYYKKVVFHSVIPFCFFLMIAGLYYYDLSRLKLLRFIAYYSYNWYLWHPLLSVIFRHYIESTVVGVVCYLGISFSIAVLFTTIVEEPFLRLRKQVINRIFKPQLQYSYRSQ